MPLDHDKNDLCDSYVVEFAPTIINEMDFAYVESNDTFIHMDHDKNVSCDSYIVEFINDATESFYERGRHDFIYHNNIKSPLSLLKILKLHLLCLPMLVTLYFIDLFSYKIPMHRKWVRLKCVWYLLFDALFMFNSYSYGSIIKTIKPSYMAVKKALCGRQLGYFCVWFFFVSSCCNKRLCV